MHEPLNSEAQTSEDKTVVQLIVFRAGNEEFGINIDAVREIIKVGIITSIPESPDFIKGIINVRGEIVTAIDIKSRFSLSVSKETESKHIIVIKKDENLFGLIVDEVIEILRILKKDIKSSPSLIDEINQKYVSGVIPHEGRLIVLLDLDQVLSHQDLIPLPHLKKTKFIEKNHKSKNNRRDKKFTDLK